MMDRSRISPLFFMMALVAASPALADNRAVCNDLHARIASIPETITTVRPARQYSTALNQQSVEIRQIQAEMQQRRCSSGSVTIINGEDAAACDQLETAFERGQQNLRQLSDMQSRNQHNGGSDDILRDQLKAALHDNGCDDTSSETTTITNRREPDATPEQQAMRTDTFIQPMDKSGGPQQGYDYQQPAAPLSYPSGGSYGANLQTVCVRTCDGGFFPLTTNASPVNFQQDAETCSRMCPGIPTELYFRYLPNQESSEMVSAATGAPYSGMPYAFAYRKRAPGEKSSCSCNMSAYYEEMRREKTVNQTQPDAGQSSITTITTQKPQSQLQPTNAPQQATVQPQVQQQPADRPYDPSTSKVRQVGPQFLATDQGKLDLKHPLAPGPQPEQ